jgi:hypothetical protein
MNHRPTFRTSFSRTRSEWQEIQELKAAQRDPVALQKEIVAFQVRLDLKKRGVLAPYVKVGER